MNPSTIAAFRRIAELQAAGKVCAFIDAGHMVNDLDALKVHGVDCGRLLVSQPDTHEQANEIAETLIRSGAVDLVVLDGYTPAPATCVKLALLAARSMSHVEKPILVTQDPAACAVVLYWPPAPGDAFQTRGTRAVASTSGTIEKVSRVNVSVVGSYFGNPVTFKLARHDLRGALVIRGGVAGTYTGDQ